MKLVSMTTLFISLFIIRIITSIKFQRDTAASFVSQLLIPLGMSDGVERGVMCEAVSRAGAGLACMIPWTRDARLAGVISNL